MRTTLREKLICCIIYHLYVGLKYMSLKRPLSKCHVSRPCCNVRHLNIPDVVAQMSGQHSQSIYGGVCCRTCTTPVPSCCTSGSSVPPLTMTTTSAWWMWTADLASSSAATLRPNAWSSTGSSLRWESWVGSHTELHYNLSFFSFSAVMVLFTTHSPGSR